jgi:hypothetical protein
MCAFRPDFPGHKGGKIRKRRAKQTIGFNACITGSGNSQIRFLKNEQAVSLQAISALRDAAQHYFREAEQISASISVRWKQNNFRAGDRGMLSLVTENNN